MNLIKDCNNKYYLKITKAEWIAMADKYDWMDGQQRTTIDPNDNLSGNSPSGSTISTWSQIRERYDDKAHRHHLKMICVKCGNEQTCRCPAKKTIERGICDECYKKFKDSGKQN